MFVYLYLYLFISPSMQALSYRAYGDYCMNAWTQNTKKRLKTYQIRWTTKYARLDTSPSMDIDRSPNRDLGVESINMHTCMYFIYCSSHTWVSG